MSAEWIQDAPRVFDLGLRSRAVDHVAKTVTLELASDEALLMDYAPLADDISQVGANSLRTVVNYVLGLAIPGAALEASPADDATITATWDATNLSPDPRNLGGAPWGAVGCTAGYDAVFPGPQDGIPHNGRALTAPTAADSYIEVGGSAGTIAAGMQGGHTYVLSAQGSTRAAVGGAVDPRARRLVVFVLAPSTGGAYVVHQSTQVPATVESGASAGTRVSVEFALPVDVTQVFVRAYLGSTAGAITWAKIRLSEKSAFPGVEETDYFWGAKPDTALYLYDWKSDPDASASDRQALSGRAPSALTWKAGTSGWAFLEPLATVSNLRLFCDELRKWRLVSPDDYSVPGYAAVSPANAVEGVDRISREDSRVFATGVVVRYLWTDGDGESRTAIDSAGTPEKVVVFDRARPYPGPGAAALILARRDGTGRTQDVTGRARWEATPGMASSIILPHAAEQLGKVDSVDWALDDSGLMRLGSRELIDVIPGSWIDWDPDEAWQDVPVTVTWESLEV